ncbi:DBD_Tnp_Mut domain-containing protein [Raphanus sativus]|nr:DBD_Tnp_Mut domain-containing protein [Raphanus sativus]
MALSFDLYFRCGGYWSNKDEYHGGEVHEAGRRVADGFTLQSILTLVEYIGYEDNMNQVSWFPPETPEKKEDITDDVIMKKVVHYSIGSGAMMLFIVREDDPYMGRHRNMRGSSDFETEERGGVIEQDDAFGVSDSEAGDSVVDDNPTIFMLGQQFSNIAAFKTAITKYAVRKRRDIKFDKSDGKRVVAICSEKKCPWRISGSINSSSTRVVVRAYQEEHNCTWQGKVSLLTNSRIADIYIEEFRINPNISATQLQQKLQRRNINHCGSCGQEGHNKKYCKSQPVPKPPKNRPGRPRKEVIPPTSAALFIHAPDATPGSRRKWFASTSQPEHDVPSLSSALPKRGPGRPRKKLSEGVSSSQP